MVHIRTVAAILMLFVVVLLILNKFLRLEWMWLLSIAMMIIAVLIYFIPRLRKFRDHVAIAERSIHESKTTGNHSLQKKT
jgi:DNA integrity scanning protein DisA with diadenylate cyclase activity